jgi:hypothetical protein
MNAGAHAPALLRSSNLRPAISFAIAGPVPAVNFGLFSAIPSKFNSH